MNYSQNFVDMVFDESNVASWRLSCFYGYPERSRRRDSWNLIRNLAGVSHLPWCILGDFDDMLYKSDKKGRHLHPNYLMDGFRITIDDSNLLELDHHGGLFTWERSRGTITGFKNVLTGLLLPMIGSGNSHFVRSR